MHKQLEHNEIEFEKRKFPISLLLDNVEDGRNVGSFFRLADAMGLQHIYLCGNTPAPPNKKIRKTARSTEVHIPYSHHVSSSELASILKEKKITVGALEITDNSTPINSYNFSQHNEIVLIAGSEEKGISADLLNQVDFAVHIPMCGINSSMNVAVASAIALQEITRQQSAQTNN